MTVFRFGLSALCLVAVSAAILGSAAGQSVTDGARVGSIRGRIELPAAPRRRSAERYLAGAAGGATARVQEIPVVVFIRGRVAGVTGVATTARLAQKDTAFTPTAVVVPVGSTVEFPNEDDFFHNVFSYSTPRRFDLGRYPRGESKTVRFDEPGVVRIYCEVHETMRSAVIVSENPFWAVVQADGGFAIDAVPVGRYELEVWHPDRDARTVSVLVEAGRTTTVAIEFE